MNNKLIIGLMICMFMLSFVSADTDIPYLGSFQQGECIPISQGCGTCSYTNLTSVINGDGVKQTFNPPLAMTKTGTDFTYLYCNTTILGSYRFQGDGDPSGSLLAWGYYADVTPSGKSGTPNMILILFLIVAIYGINLAGFFGKNEIMTLLGGMALMFLGVYLVNNGIIIYRDNLTNYFAYITIAWGAISSIMAGISLMDV